MNKKLIKLGVFFSVFFCFIIFLSVVNFAQATQTLNINTNGTDALFSSYRGANSDGYNIWIGGGGQSSLGAVGNTGYGSYNTALGYESLYANSTGTNNVAIGFRSLYNNTMGNNNTAGGSSSLRANISGSYNTAYGVMSLNKNTTGAANTANGANSLSNNTTGNSNSSFGTQSLYSNIGGSSNSALGYDAGRYIFDGSTGRTSGDYGLYLGYASKASANGTTNETVIGYDAIGNGSNSVTLGNDSVTKTILKGKIGVGKTNPYYDLDISASGSNQAGIWAGNISEQSTAIMGVTASSSDIYMFAIGPNVDINGLGQGSVNLIGSTEGLFNIQSEYGDMRFLTSRLPTTKEVMRLTLGGLVGIGTTSPSTAKLVIATSTTNYSIDLGNYRVGNVGTPVINSDAATKSYVDTAVSGSSPWLLSGSNLYASSTSWNVGIGTTNPAQQLEISKNFRLPSSIGAVPYGVIYKDGFRFIHDFSYGNNGTVTPYGQNTFVGVYAGNFTMGSTATSAVHSSYNTGIGFFALINNTTGYSNTVVGVSSLSQNTTGSNNTAIGHEALSSNTTGANNVAMGKSALYSNTGGSNTAIGAGALYSNTTGYQNTVLGSNSLLSNTVGLNNTAVGFEAGRYLANGSTGRTTGNNGLYLGYNSKASTDGTDNEIVLGYNAIGNGSNSATLGNDSITKTILKGNVGIGTTNPLKKLQVAQDLTYSQSQSGQLYLSSADGIKRLMLGYDSSNNFGFIEGVNFGTAYSNVVINPTQGNVGIRTTNPTSPLTVNSDSDGNVFNFKINNVSYFSMTGFNLLYGRNSGGSVTLNNPIIFGNNTMGSLNNTPFFLINPISDTAGNLFEVRNGVNPKFLINVNGNVGIGTTSPTTAQLVIGAAINNYALDVANFRIGGLATPLFASDAATKAYVDSAVSSASPLIMTRRAVADTDDTATTTDNIIAYTSITAARTVTIPTAVCSAGRTLTISDESGSLSATTTITIVPTSGSIVGTSTFVLSEPYNNISIYCNGTSNAWFVY